MPLDTYLELAPTYQTPGRIHVAKYARNGLVPHAVFESRLAASLNFVAAVRTKQLFHGWRPIADIPSGSATPRDAWRFAAHTGPLLRRIVCRLTVAQALTTVGGGVGTNPTVKLFLTNADESVTYGSGTFVAGASGTTPNDTPDEFIDGTIEFGDVPADTDVYGRFEESNGGRLISATVYERSLGITAANGYVVPAPVSVNAPIYDARRQRMYELATLLWKRQGAHLWNFSVDNQASPKTNASATATNVIDGSTAVSAASVGATLDLRYCRTRSKTVVPCVFKVFAKMSGASDTGEVSLVDSTGTPVVTISVSGSTAQWYSETVDMPASLAKYDVMFANPDFAFGAETISVYAFSLYQYQA